MEEATTYRSLLNKKERSSLPSREKRKISLRGRKRKSLRSRRRRKSKEEKNSLLLKGKRGRIHGVFGGCLVGVEVIRGGIMSHVALRVVFRICMRYPSIFEIMPNVIMVIVFNSCPSFYRGPLWIAHNYEHTYGLPTTYPNLA